AANAGAASTSRTRCGYTRARPCLDVARFQHAPVCRVHGHRLDSEASLALDEDEPLTARIRLVPVGPGRHREQNRLQVEPAFGEHVLEAASFDRPALEDAFVDEPIESHGQDVARDAEALLELLETLGTEERVTQHQQSPALAYHVERLRERAVHVVERFEFHEEILDQPFDSCIIKLCAIESVSS